MKMALIRACAFFIILNFVKLVSSSSLFDEELYKRVLNNETCTRQLQEINLVKFFDASGVIPQSYYLGGQGSLGNYHQCLSLADKVEASNETVYGKYCLLKVTGFKNKNGTINNHGLSDDSPLDWAMEELYAMDDNIKTEEALRQFRRDLLIMTGKGNLRSEVKLGVTLAVCLPKSCTVKDTIGKLLDHLNVTHNFLYCRLPNDKIFDVWDYLAVVALVIFVLFILTSTAYDLHQTFVLRKSVVQMNKLLTCGSIYTNTRRLLTFKTTPTSIECLEGVRALSILWVVVGHSVAHTMIYNTITNYKTAYEWASRKDGMWLVSAVLSVDSFFLMSGLLLVYTSLKKLTKTSLRKNLHWFYLYRLLRMFPLLFFMVIFQATLFHHMGDGPMWPDLAPAIEACRNYWWSAFIHVQNWVNPSETCLSQTWYLSVDSQLYLFAPIVLYWVLSDRRSAFYSLTSAMVISCVITIIYCCVKNFSGVSVLSMMMDDAKVKEFYNEYYINTVTRSPAFIVGMIFGYWLHVWRESPLRLAKWMVAVGWLTSGILMYMMIYAVHPGADFPGPMINFLNAFMRPIWATAVGWVVFACALGYGGPVNWFLSWKMWKFIARVSYSLYLVHLPLQLIIRGQLDTPVMFSVPQTFNTLHADLVVSLLAATALCVVVDAPFSTIQKILVPDSWITAIPVPVPQEVQEAQVEIEPEVESLIDEERQ